ncbi:alpha/beta fold hydrolase [Gordonia sp. (in: high G+C Gram-positive bacteria)]|uniref:alpha/beta hydrolase family protein n=1 Tax=Gordonia sp. (in: high G+C Gram-positive bacteria) TaxID=84139 RepID=UPI0025C310FC|nr:alpha/beta fold hydrolase [Gordonia sp. (in: high G+C Gram-positive bacteria)]
MSSSAVMSRSREALFDSDFLDRFGRWPVGFIPAGGADIGDVVAVADVVGDGDESDFYDAFVASGDAKAADARALLAKGRRRSARDRFLRASCMYGAAYHPIYGAPTDPRLLAAFDTQMSVFHTAMQLGETPVDSVRIPFGGHDMPAYLVPATHRPTEVRPLLIVNNGYDATITDIYFAMGVAALARGYHVLMFDGPGQGEMLYRHGIPLRPDWETVISAVVDYAETVDIVDPDRIALSGWSLGGYFAPRAASGEPRLAACIADPGQWDIGESVSSFLTAFGVTDRVPPAELDDAVLDEILRHVLANRIMRWQIVQRGFWANGVSDLRSYFQSLAEFTLRDRVGEITCPTLLTSAENDPLARSTREFYDALTCPKELLSFTAALDGAGDHCEMGNRSLLNQRVLDWLDEVLGVG